MASAWTGKPCQGCDGKKGKSYLSKKYCGRCMIQVKQANKRAAHAARIERVYGITADDYQALLEYQGGVCFLCRRATGKSKRLAVDHDHETGAVRGLLCSTCNNILGHARDDPDYFLRAADYLKVPAWTALLWQRACERGSTFR